MIFVFFSAVFCSSKTTWVRTIGIQLGRIRPTVAAVAVNNNDIVILFTNVAITTRPVISYDMISLYRILPPFRFYLEGSARHRSHARRRCIIIIIIIIVVHIT